MGTFSTGRSATDTDSILQCLADHVQGRVELSATQIRAAEILLRRATPSETPAFGPAGREPVTEVVNILVPHRI